jgi:trehalose 6-phosphate synthase
MLRVWNKNVVLDLVKDKFSDYLFVVVSNRQPYIHKISRGKIECLRGPGGVITALDPIMQELKGLWVCCGSGNADKLVAKEGKVKVPPHNPSYQLKYVWLSKEENLGYYYGYSNQALWPLSHLVFVKPIFREEDWLIYKEVNKKFAQNIYEEVKGKKAIVFVQDYHLGLVSKYLKEMTQDVITLLFWHIPWPTYDVFRILPQKQEFLEGLLSYDLLGFHIRYFCNNFLNAVANEMETKINREHSCVVYKGNTTLVHSYPISVDFEGINNFARSEEVEKYMSSLKEEFGLSDYKVIVGLDRIDYTKGIAERIQAIDKLFDLHPELKEKVVFIQMGEISRIHIAQYKQLNDYINFLVEEVNFKHSVSLWKPITFVRRHLKFSELLAFYRLADVCIVSSLHDGMNLVAKEFVSSRIDEKGALVLSKFTGASRELTDAILINPFSPIETAQGLFYALSMEDNEVRKRMRKLRQVVHRNNIWKWIGKIISNIPKKE